MSIHPTAFQAGGKQRLVYTSNNIAKIHNLSIWNSSRTSATTLVMNMEMWK